MLKLEIRIGEKQFYKIKSLPEFYDRFLKKKHIDMVQNLSLNILERCF